MGDNVLEREIDTEASGGRGGVAMDTPDRKQINTPRSKFEDSPVFNYLNNLSPLQPVKSIHISQTFNSVTFASPPSVFTSPHVTSTKESRFLRRHQSAEPSKPEFSSVNVNEVGKHEEVVGVAHSSDQKKSFNPGRTSAEPPHALNLEIELSRTSNYRSVNPDSEATACSEMETSCLPELTGLSTALVPYVQTDSGNCQVGDKPNIGGTSEIDQNREVSGSDWENLLSDEADLLIFDSPDDSKSSKDPNQKLPEPKTSLCTSLPNDLQNSVATHAVGPCQQYETENTSLQRTETGNTKKIAEDQDLLVSLSNFEEGDTNEIVDHELDSNMHRGLRRRCLVFEMVGSRGKHSDDVSNIGPSILSDSCGNISSSDKCFVPKMPKNDTSRRVLPGIGLHLNALTSASVNREVVNHETSTTVVRATSVLQSADCLDSSNKLEISNNSVLSLSERDLLPAGDNILIAEDVAQASDYTADGTFNHNSPRKKRRRMESGGESEACKRCNCKKSKCLKLYCECFAAGVYCVEPCSCRECFNKPIHEDVVLATRRQIESRNPLAFAPKVIRSAESMTEVGEESSKTPASARHKRGCNCKKSGCTKKYCECYQGGVGCSVNCRCEGCKNAFGRKDGSFGIEFELDDEQEISTCGRSVVNRSLQITTVENDAEGNTIFALPETPLQFGRQSSELPLSSNKRPPRSTFFAVGSSSGQKFRKLINPPQAMIEKQNQIVQEDEMPDILQSPISDVKLASPNSKRVSPPHCNSGVSLSQRSSRKLILQSISSFPSLTPKQ